MPTTHQPRICVFGAAPDTGNRGVNALGSALLAGIHERAPGARITLFDNGFGLRRASEPVPGGEFEYDLYGARYSRYLHHPESLYNMDLSVRLGGLRNPGARAICEADLVMDVTGGDSFTDLYGPKRFWMSLYPKRIALRAGPPLLLLPQTYGPFGSDRFRRISIRVLRAASGIWARDERNYAELQELLGDSFDPSRHRCGVDLAFGLASRRPASLGGRISEWISPQSARPTIGLNVSGMIYHGGAAASLRYGLRADYSSAVHALLERVLERTDFNVVLLPHVVSSSGHDYSDPEACAEVEALFAPRFGERIAVADSALDHAELKWLISQLDWFCGTRMHSTIAALSSGVPCTAIAYSLKTLGVFETCGQGSRVADPRKLGTDEVVELAWRSLEERAESRESLRGELPGVMARAGHQMDRFLEACAV